MDPTGPYKCQRRDKRGFRRASAGEALAQRLSAAEQTSNIGEGAFAFAERLFTLIASITGSL